MGGPGPAARTRWHVLNTDITDHERPIISMAGVSGADFFYIFYTSYLFSLED